jgi:hypothetical protein
MKKLTGRDFEDILQCAIPVFEGLFPAPHDQLIMDLLFTLATWHACAKLRLHMESTLTYLDDTMKLLRQTMRRFVSTTCMAFVTRELPKEEAARSRRRATAARKTSKAWDQPLKKTTKETDQPVTKATVPKHKLFNLCTYKLHALGNYTKTIHLFGTSDSYSTQVVCYILISVGLLNKYEYRLLGQPIYQVLCTQ